MIKSFLHASLTILALFGFSSAIACSCTSRPILELVEVGYTDHLIELQVTDTQGVSPGSTSFMEGTVVRQFRGEIDEQQIRIDAGDGLSCIPYATEFNENQSWLLAIANIDGRYLLNSCHPRIAIEDDTLTGHITPFRCSDHPGADTPCHSLTQEELSVVQAEQLSIPEFEAALALYSSAVNWTLNACTGPWERCTVRPSFNPATGELTLPGIDVLDDPLTYGISGSMQLIKDEPVTFEVIELNGIPGN